MKNENKKSKYLQRKLNESDKRITVHIYVPKKSGRPDNMYVTMHVTIFILNNISSIFKYFSVYLANFRLILIIHLSNLFFLKNGKI